MIYNKTFGLNYESPAHKCASAHRALPGMPDGQSMPACNKSNIAFIVYRDIIIIVGQIPSQYRIVSYPYRPTPTEHTGTRQIQRYCTLKYESVNKV